MAVRRKIARKKRGPTRGPNGRIEISQSLNSNREQVFRAQRVGEIRHACTLISSHPSYDTEARSLTAMHVGIAMIDDLPSRTIILRCASSRLFSGLHGSCETDCFIFTSTDLSDETERSRRLLGEDEFFVVNQETKRNLYG